MITRCIEQTALLDKLLDSHVMVTYHRFCPKVKRLLQLTTVYTPISESTPSPCHASTRFTSRLHQQT